MWYVLFCLVMGVLQAASANWVARAIEDRRDSSDIMTRLLVLAWLFLVFTLGIVYHIENISQGEVKALEERVTALEDASRADAIRMEDVAE